jgi:uncharacterized protein (DUF58 family)
LYVLEAHAMHSPAAGALGSLALPAWALLAWALLALVLLALALLVLALLALALQVLPPAPAVLFLREASKRQEARGALALKCRFRVCPGPHAHAGLPGALRNSAVQGVQACGPDVA